MLILALDPAEPFTAYLAATNASADALLTQAPTDTDYLFLPSASAMNASGSEAVQRLQAQLAARLSLLQSLGTLSLARAAAWRAALHFGALAPANGSFIAEWLSTWTSPWKSIAADDGSGAPEVVAPRLDGHYTWCAWPGDGDTGILLDAGDACQPPSAAFAAWQSQPTLGSHTGKTLRVSPPSPPSPAPIYWLADLASARCNVSTAIANAQRQGAAGVLFAQALTPAEPVLQVLGTDAAAAANPVDVSVATVAASDAAAMRARIHKAAASGRNATVVFRNSLGPGLLVGLDSGGRLIELGWEKYATLMMLGWQAQWQGYTDRLQANLSAPAVVVPVWNDVQMQGSLGATATVTVPALATLGPLLELDLALTCPGTRDASCPTWDHTIQLFACCSTAQPPANASVACAQELGRWISPFRRRIGRWLTPISSLAPLLAGDGHGTVPQQCAFAIRTAAWAMPWRVTLSIRSRLALLEVDAGAAMEQPLPTALVPLFEGGTFDSSYNNRTPIEVAIPAVAQRVMLEAVITGHGSDNNGELK